MKLKKNKISLILGLLVSGLILLSFQNCMQPGFYSISEESLLGCTSPSCEAYFKNRAPCRFNGTFVHHEQEFTAYLNSNGVCQSETRTCENGSLTGSYPFAFCKSGNTEPGSCIFGNQTIHSGDSVTAYLNGSGNCTSERRTCIDGNLSGSYLFGSCHAEGQAPCLYNGETIKSGDVVRAFQNSAVGFGETCKDQLRLCTNGVLSGSYQYPSCGVSQPRSCLINGVAVPHQGHVTTYKTSTVGYGASCESQVRTCNDGTMSGSFPYASCNVGAPAHCLLNRNTIVHGQTVEAFLASTVPYGEECRKQTRSCSNGNLSGSYTFPDCNVGEPSSCRLDGRIYNHGSRMRAYAEAKEDGSCDTAERTCHNGTFSGNDRFKYVSCKANDGTGSDGNGGSGNPETSVTCASGQIAVGDQCFAENSTCTSAQKSKWKTLAKSGNHRARVAWFYCEFTGKYYDQTEFETWVSYRKYNREEFCGMALTTTLLWDQCQTKTGSRQLPVCHDSTTSLVKKTYQTALGRLPNDDRDQDRWFLTELDMAVRDWNNGRGGSTYNNALIYLRKMCYNNTEFKNRHKDFL